MAEKNQDRIRKQVWKPRLRTSDNQAERVVLHKTPEDLAQSIRDRLAGIPIESVQRDPSYQQAKTLVAAMEKQKKSEDNKRREEWGLRETPLAPFQIYLTEIVKTLDVIDETTEELEALGAPVNPDTPIDEILLETTTESEAKEILDPAADQEEAPAQISTQNKRWKIEKLRPKLVSTLGTLLILLASCSRLIEPANTNTNLNPTATAAEVLPTTTINPLDQELTATVPVLPTATATATTPVTAETPTSPPPPEATPTPEATPVPPPAPYERPEIPANLNEVFAGREVDKVYHHEYVGEGLETGISFPIFISHTGLDMLEGNPYREIRATELLVQMMGKRFLMECHYKYNLERRNTGGMVNYQQYLQLVRDGNGQYTHNYYKEVSPGKFETAQETLDPRMGTTAGLEVIDDLAYDYYADYGFPHDVTGPNFAPRIFADLRVNDLGQPVIILSMSADQWKTAMKANKNIQAELSLFAESIYNFAFGLFGGGR